MFRYTLQFCYLLLLRIRATFNSCSLYVVVVQFTICTDTVQIKKKGVFDVHKDLSAVLTLCGSVTAQMQSEEQKQKVEKVRLARQKKLELTPELREKHSKHRETYHMTRQPLLDGLASEYDMELFKEAQARACELLVSDPALPVCS